MEIKVSEYHITFYPKSKYEAYLLGRVDAVCPAGREETAGGESLVSLTFVINQLLRAAGGIKDESI